MRDKLTQLISIALTIIFLSQNFTLDLARGHTKEETILTAVGIDGLLGPGQDFICTVWSFKYQGVPVFNHEGVPDVAVYMGDTFKHKFRDTVNSTYQTAQSLTKSKIFATILPLFASYIIAPRLCGLDPKEARDDFSYEKSRALESTEGREDVKGGEDEKKDVG